MKILHVVSSYWPAFEFGGPIESVHNLNKELAKKGVDITVYTTNSGLRNIRMSDIQKLNLSISGMSDIQNIGKGKCEIDGVKIYYLPYYGYVHWTFSPDLFWLIKKNIKNFDLIHITGIWNFPVWAGAFWARFYKKPYIISPRGSLMKEPLEKKSSLKKRLHLLLIARKDLKNASALHFTVEAEKEEYLKAGLPIKKAIVIPNGIDIQFQEVRPPEINRQYLGGRTSQVLRTSDIQKLEFRKKFNIAPDRKIVLFLSRLNWIKGLNTLIPAFAEVVKKEPKAVLVLAGGDEENYKKEIMKMIDEINIETSDVLRTSDVQDINPHKSAEISINQCFNIIFTGMLIGEEKFAAFRESDVFVLPSYSENFGNVVLEAMYFGLPVIITKYVGISPSIKKAGAGLVINKDEKQLAEAILKILENPELAQKMGTNGKKLIETEFSSEKVTENWIKEYKNLIKNIN